MKQLTDVIFFFPHLSNFFFSLLFELGSTEHPDCCSVYLGQESSFMYVTPRQSRRTERGDEGRWWRTPTQSLWGQALLSSFYPLLPSLYCILIGWLMYHGNSLWMQEAGEAKGKVAAAEKRLKCDVEAVCTLFFLSRAVVDNLLMQPVCLRQMETLFKMQSFRYTPWHFLSSYFVLLFPFSILFIPTILTYS